jgi:SAM-dependent methyltransferase
MDLPGWAPDGIDIGRPSAARVYDYFLGGAHNFAVDRALADQIARTTPNLAETMRANRVFLRRAVRYLTEQGIRQFLDIGSGIPTVGNVHEVAQEEAPDSTVVYVDVDPVAVAHSRSILEANKQATVVCADLRDTGRIADEARQSGLIDFGAPVAVLLAGVVHFIPDVEDPDRLVAQLRELLTPGGFLLVSHATADEQPPEMLAAQRLSGRTDTEITLRSRADIEGYLDGLTLVDPGVVFIPRWRPDPGETVEHPERIGAYAAVGRKD